MTSEINLEKVAGFCRGGRKRKVLKIADFQNFSSFCFRYEWSQRDMFNTFYHADNHWVPKMVQIKMYQDIVPNLSLSYR